MHIMCCFTVDITTPATFNSIFGAVKCLNLKSTAFMNVIT